jgi:predicted nuclease of predicted toxin-antitoxin system
MKLLFDENLPPKLPGLLASLFPESRHVRECGLLGKTDAEVWDYAGANGFVVISKDSDFQQRSLLQGSPPKLIWLRIGNCSRRQLLNLIRAHEQDIRAFEGHLEETILILS